MSDPKLPPYSNFCKCPACGEYFNSVSGFEYHRVNGACVPPNERGMKVNAKGYWIRRSRDTAHAGRAFDG